MKKRLLPLAIAALFFILTYLSLCYLIPDLRIKLAADPLTYFLQSVRHMLPFKTFLSLLVGITAAILSHLIIRKFHK